MAISFRISPELALVYIRYWDVMGLEESRTAAIEYMSHPSFRPGLRHVVDLTDVMDYERDYADVLKLQAEHLDMFHNGPAPQLVMAIAPTELTQAVAALVMRSWENHPAVICTMCRSRDEALDILGLRQADKAAVFDPA